MEVDEAIKTVMNLDRISVIKVNDGYAHLVILAAHLVTSLMNIVHGRCKRITLASQIKSLAGFMVLDNYHVWDAIDSQAN